MDLSGLEAPLVVQTLSDSSMEAEEGRVANDDDDEGEGKEDEGGAYLIFVTGTTGLSCGKNSPHEKCEENL